MAIPTITLTNDKKETVTVDVEQWSQTAHVTGWDEKSAREAGWKPADEKGAKALVADYLKAQAAAAK